MEGKPARLTALRKDLGGGYFVHVDLIRGLVGFSRREGNTPLARPAEAEVWLEDEKAQALLRIVGEVVRVKEKEPTITPPPLKSSNSPFFQANFGVILKQPRGKMVRPPWWLRWLYDAVVTKDNYGND